MPQPNLDKVLGKWTSMNYWDSVMPDDISFKDWGLKVVNEYVLACGTILVVVDREK